MFICFTNLCYHQVQFSSTMCRLIGIKTPGNPIQSALIWWVLDPSRIIPWIPSFEEEPIVQHMWSLFGRYWCQLFVRCDQKWLCCSLSSHIWNSVVYVQVLGENCGEPMIWSQRSWLDCRFPCKYSRGFIVKYNAKNHWKTTRVDTFLWPFVNKSCWLGDSSTSVVNCPASHLWFLEAKLLEEYH